MMVIHDIYILELQIIMNVRDDHRSFFTLLHQQGKRPEKFGPFPSFSSMFLIKVVEHSFRAVSSVV